MDSSGHETRRHLARLPWLSYALVLAFVAATLYSEAARRSLTQEARTAFREVELYLDQHPYLEVAPAAATLLDGDALDEKRARYEAERMDRVAPPIPPGVQRRRQGKLDALIATSLEPLEALPTRRWGLVATRPAGVELVTYSFPHAGWLPLVAGSLFLLLFGHALEPVWGRPLLGLMALGGAAVAALVFRAANPELQRPLVGCVGMVSTLLGAYLTRFAGSREGVVPAVSLATATWLAVPVWLGLGWWLAPGLERASLPSGASGPAHWAIAGGLAFGLAGTLALRLTGIETWLAPAARAPGGPDPEFERALRARAAGRLDSAYDQLCALLRRDADHPGALLTLWDVARGLRRPAEAAAAMVRAIRGEVRRGDNEAAVEHWLELCECGSDVDADPSLLIRMAALLHEAGRDAAARDALRRALERASGASVPVVATRVARAARGLDPETAEDAAWRALGSLELSMEERQSLEALIGSLLSREPRPPSAPRRRAEPPHPLQSPRGAASAAAQWQAPGVLEAPPAPSEPQSDALVREEVPIQQPGFTRPTAIDLDAPTRALHVVHATPLGLSDDGLSIQVHSDGGAKKRVRFERIQAIGVAAVNGLGPKPVILVDLVLNWMTMADEPLRLIRIRGDRFDPRRLAPGSESPVEALREILGRLLEHTQATPVPDARSARGMPFAFFPDLSTYHRNVLMVAGDESAAAFSWDG